MTVRDACSLRQQDLYVSVCYMHLLCMQSSASIFREQGRLK